MTICKKRWRIQPVINKGHYDKTEKGIVFPTSVGRGGGVEDCLMGLTTSGGGEGVGLRGFAPLGTRVVDLNNK
jgi:hypothetical protein